MIHLDTNFLIHALQSLEQSGPPQGDIQDHVRIQQDAHGYFACLPSR